MRFPRRLQAETFGVNSNSWCGNTIKDTGETTIAGAADAL